MRDYVFLLKKNTGSDYDCVQYISIRDIKEFHTDITGHFNVHGPGFSMSLKSDVPYENITTVLTEEEYDILCNPKDGYILDVIVDKLLSKANNDLFEEVQKEEIEFLCNEYGFDDEDVIELFDNYPFCGYRDRNIVSGVFNDTNELGYDTIWNYGTFDGYNGRLDKYFDFTSFGEDLAEDDYRFYTLSDQRIVCCNV